MNFNDHLFISTDATTIAVCPAMCEAAITFAENGPEEQDYNTFTDLRQSMQERFNNPYDLERFEDETGKGFCAGISHRQSPTDEAWALLERYLKAQGFVHYEYQFTGIYKTVSRIGTQVVDRSEGNSYKIKLYTEVK